MTSPAGGGTPALPVPADVTDRAAVFAAVARPRRALRTLDVVVNNAGTLSIGMVEEFTEAEAASAMETNFFGALWVSQAVVPALRAQRSGHLVQISSIGGARRPPAHRALQREQVRAGGPGEALAAEAAAFGVRSTIVEPGGYWTDLYTRMR